MEYEDKKTDFRYNLKEYFNFITKYKFILTSLILSIIFFESLTFLNSLFFKNIIDNSTAYLAKEITREIFIKLLIYIAIAFSLVVLIRVFLRWMNIHLINLLEANSIIDLKTKYFNHILGLSHKFHTTHKTGSLISRLGRGVGAMESLTDAFIFQLIPLIVQLFVIGFSVYYFNKTTGLIIVLMTITFILYSFYLQRKQEESKLALNKAEDTEKAFVGDIFTNIDSKRF